MVKWLGDGLISNERSSPNSIHLGQSISSFQSSKLTIMVNSEQIKN